ncbi:universal stress protein [Prauserella marina]|uniref:Nucleotide-binding universal stress protein, UspA family n=1 Tax=Prauserella marina TaxID=530584 RepID=A0A222VRZ2_9PSEU|nr:universal stress protein [Prauserella marina]ASR36503.1 universal stress protein [Prauserella marina]PWV73885.1 nucleotide-binding universal stress UspA family protein [Prauserella marina]SDD58197.1 Nucleotide-binding universal stress protein, UspA family [Prauserella marina]
MNGNAPILAGVDGSTSALRATAWAARTAARRHAPLVLVSTMLMPVPYGAGIGPPAGYFSGLEAEGERRLAEAEEHARLAAAGAGELTVSTEFHIGNPVPILRERARAARMLVLGTRGLGELTGTFVGSVAVALVSHGPCPVAVVRGRGQDGEPPAEGPVVVGVDGSSTSEAAVAAAFEEAAVRGTSLIAVHAWSDASFAAMAGLEGLGTEGLAWDEIQTKERLVLAERLAGWQERYPEVSVERVVRRDRPLRGLLEPAARAQLLVVGSRGRGGFSGMLLGSTSNALVYSAPCPVLIVRRQPGG